MKKILIYSEQSERFARLADRMSADGTYAVSNIGTGQADLKEAAGSTPALLIIDEEVKGRPGLEIARDVVMSNPMVNLAVVSSLSEEDFHEASEGLGILARVSPEPGEKDGALLLEALAGVNNT